MASVKDKIIWLTGASSGIGEALAYSLVVKGAILIISSRREQELERVKNSCSNPDKVSILPIDLHEPGTLLSVSEKAISIHGKIDILINNSGISQRSFAIETIMDVDRKIMEVNYFGTIALTKAVLPQMKKNKAGHIVTISSVAGKVSTPLRSAYAASKHALHGFYDALRAEVYEDNIKVTLICPGYIKTNISYNAMTGSGNTFNQQSDGQEGGIPADICANKIVTAIEKEKAEYFVAGFKEHFGLFVKRFIPSLMRRVIRKMKTV